MIILG